MPALHVETHGEGPLVVICPGLWAGAGADWSGLIDALSTDHRVLTYDLRDTGRSERIGPHDLATDVADLTGIVADHEPPATLVGTGAGSNLALHVLVEHPDLATAVICPSGSPVLRAVGEQDDSFAGSRSVFRLLSEMAMRDYRGFLHSIVASTNSQLDDAGVAARVAQVAEAVPHAVMVERLRAWTSDDAVAISLAAGPRLSILLSTTDPWTSTGAAETTRALLPEAEVLEVADGPLSRPDLCAAVVRRRTGVAA